MDGQTLDVLPQALQAAAGIISGHATRVGAPAGTVRGSAETAGAAAAAADAALDNYCRAFSQRLTSVAAAVSGAAAGLNGMEADNSAALASVAPGGRA